MNATSDYVTVPEAAKILGISEATAWRWIKSGRIRANRLGPKRVLIARAELPKLVQPIATEGSQAVPRELSEAEIQHNLAALERMRQTREEMSAARGGKLFPNSVDIIREFREQRSRERS